MADQVTIQGAVEKIVFASEDGHYAVIGLREASGELVTVVGNFVELQIGEELRVEGRWTSHRRFGEQFRAEHYTVSVPATAKGLEKYLASGLVEGIGPDLAARIVKRFGPQTLEILDQAPERLREVDGIGPKRGRAIHRAWQQQKGIRDVMVFLQGHGVTTAYAVRIFQAYGPGAISVVRHTPYRLASEIVGVGFRTADAIAREVGITSDADARIDAGLLYTLQRLGDEGHVCYPRQSLIAEAARILEVDASLVEPGLERQRQAGEIVVAEDADQSVYARPVHTAEVETAEKLRTLIGARSTLPSIEAPAAVRWVQSQVHTTLAEDQRRALLTALQSKVAVLTGGPGVGKTMIVDCLLRIYGKKSVAVALAAPTGRAAKKLAEVTGHEAQTIHRLLKYSPRQRRFERNEELPLEAPVIVVDEASMIDIHLMHGLLKALPVTAHLLLVGDVDQLPSVGPGNVLRDIIDSGAVPVVRLTEIFRQARHSHIISNAHRVNQGEMPDLKARHGDFYFIAKEDPDEVVETIKRLCTERIPNRFQLDPITDVQVIAPMHRGTVGVANLNRVLQELLNPHEVEIQRFNRTFGLGDKVMQTRNNYDKDVYNGDIGRIAAINRVEDQVSVRYESPGRLVAYKMSELDELVPAYAISAHKSQGSEYPAVIIPLLAQHYMLLQRNLLYTAMTRAQKLLVIVGTPKAVAMAVRNDRIRQRFTGLKERLREKV